MYPRKVCGDKSPLSQMIRRACLLQRVFERNVYLMDGAKADNFCLMLLVLLRTKHAHSSNTKHSRLNDQSRLLYIQLSKVQGSVNQSLHEILSYSLFSNVLPVFLPMKNSCLFHSNYLFWSVLENKSMYCTLIH